MKPDLLWRRYATSWSLPEEERKPELSVCLSAEVTYCDPNGLIEGRSALSNYMSQFQQSVPGGHFAIESVLSHHRRSLAHWSLHGPDGRLLQTGTSFAALSEDGRLQTITGFFYPAKEEQPA